MNSRYDESNKEPHVCKESDKNFQETQTDDAELATLPPPPLPFGYTIQELMSHNHELQTQKEQLEMKNKAMKNQLKSAQTTMNQKNVSKIQQNLMYLPATLLDSNVLLLTLCGKK